MCQKYLIVLTWLHMKTCMFSQKVQYRAHLHPRTGTQQQASFLAKELTVPGVSWFAASTPFAAPLPLTLA